MNPCCLLWRSSCTHHMTCNPRIHLFCIFLSKLEFTGNILNAVLNTYQTCRMVYPEMMFHLLQMVEEELILPLAYLWLLELEIFFLIYWLKEAKLMMDAVNLRLLDNFLTVSDILQAFSELWVSQRGFVFNFFVISNIHFIIMFILNVIIDFLFHLSNSQVLYLNTSLELGDKCCWMIQSKELICFGVLQIFISNFCLLPKIQDSIRKLTCRKHSYLNLLLLYFCQRLISQFKKGI